MQSYDVIRRSFGALSNHRENRHSGDKGGHHFNDTLGDFAYVLLMFVEREPI